MFALIIIIQRNSQLQATNQATCNQFEVPTVRANNKPFRRGCKSSFQFQQKCCKRVYNIFVENKMNPCSAKFKNLGSLDILKLCLKKEKSTLLG